MRFVNKVIRSKKIFIFLGICLLFATGYYIYEYLNKPSFVISPYPDGKNFAFTITDDPDKNRFERTKIVYDFLSEEGLRTTALVWVKRADKTNLPPIKPVVKYKYGDTTEKKEYLEYFQNLHLTFLAGLFLFPWPLLLLVHHWRFLQKGFLLFCLFFPLCEKPMTQLH